MTARAVVSFDLDETLWEFLPMMDGALRATLEALEARRPQLRGAITLEELHRVRGRVAATQQGTYEQLRQESFRQVLEAHGETDPELPPWMVATWMDARVTSVVLHPDVAAVVPATATLASSEDTPTASSARERSRDMTCPSQVIFGFPLNPP